MMRKTACFITLLGATLLLSSCMTFNTPPIAEFSFDPMGGWAPLEVSFDASASIDPDGQIVAYDWEFGDSDADSGVTVVHTYHTPGTYTIRFHAIDDEGDFTTKTATIVVDEPPVDIESIWPWYGWTSTFVTGTARNLLNERLAFAEIVVIFLDAAGREVDQGIQRQQGIAPGQSWTYTVHSAVAGTIVDSVIVFVGQVEVE
jgi:PKD repeat protein